MDAGLQDGRRASDRSGMHAFANCRKLPQQIDRRDLARAAPPEPREPAMDMRTYLAACLLRIQPATTAPRRESTYA